jgi:hypothetical protein
VFFSLSVAACKHPHFRTELIANLKLQTNPMKAAIGNHQILRLPIVSQRPTSAGRQMLVNVCLLLKSGHSEAVNDRQPTASLQNSALRIILIKE